MSRYYERNDSGYTRGGLDVVTGINLFFKGILIFPILVLATYLGLAMVKHMIFQGVPTMSQPTEEQREVIRERDAQISAVPEGNTPEVSLEVSPYRPSNVNNGYPQPPVLPAPSYQSNRYEEPSWNTEILESPFD
jgi:hypothetical protein